ncbi:hypothetical protein ACFQ1M_03145 [Sungkyunkwania multivorans]|uniref:DUF3052 domain-containing protein n=1 Tax=Sungkyunkwania multivorans TaxID=1173618 RepID=A0ABW3CTV7_9FLAO
MNQLFKKLQLNDHPEVLILNKPEGFDEELDIPDGFEVKESLVVVTKVDFALVFVTSQKELEEQMETLAPKLDGDAILWFACPRKGSSHCAIDSLTKDNDQWTILGNHYYERVRAIVIDDNWTATRFRKVEFHKKLTT